VAATGWLPPGGALLVRPDAVVAWRSDGPVDDPIAVLIDVLGTVLDPACMTGPDLGTDLCGTGDRSVKEEARDRDPGTGRS
jgi:hypothetical protein